MNGYALSRKGYKREKSIREQLTVDQNIRLNVVINVHAGGYSYLSRPGFPKILGDLTNMDERIKIEIPFLVMEAGIIRDFRVFDACLGTGATTIGLKKYGIENVVSNEIDEEFVDYAEGKADAYGVDLNITTYDWRELPKKLQKRFDVVCCLGNSLTYLFKQEDRQEAVDNFASTLKPGGRLVIDIRNYTELLRGNFLNTGKGPYRNMQSDFASMNPTYVAPDMTLFHYEMVFSGRGFLKHDLLLCPIKDGEMECMLQSAGFKDIKIYGDYEKDFNPKTTEFYTFIGTKS